MNPREDEPFPVLMARGRGKGSIGSHVRYSTLSDTQMKLLELLRKQRSSILGAWIDLVINTYPAETQRFLQKQKDSFANPVGTTLSAELEHIFAELLQGGRQEKLWPCLDTIIRVRAIQDFSPSQAVAFLLHLKKVIRRELGDEIRENDLVDELADMDAKIDQTALLAFDIYVKCREKLYEIKADKAGRQVSRLLLKAGLACEIPAWEPKKKDHNHSQ